MAYTWLNQLGGYNLASTSYSVDNLPPNPYSDTITVGNTPVDTDADSNWYINANVKIAHNKTSAVWLFYIDDEENNVNLVQVSGINASYIITFTFLIAIDYDNQKAYAIPIVNYSNQWAVYDWEFTEADKVRFYQLIKDDIPPLYNWQSVPSISGKNGILSLTQIKAESINDGEPVSGASDSAFTGMSDDNNVATLVDVGELNNNKAKVVYNIPALTSGNYSYAKLVYKQGFIPTSKDDGIAVDLDLTDLGTNKTITVSNIVSGSVYWFVIFTDKSESDAVSLGENTEGVFFELDLTTDGRDVIRYNPAKEFLGAKQGELVGNNFTISDGVLDTSYDISWYYDPTENPKSIPADCTLTFEYDTFFPNGEGYLDWYIIDSDDTERIYWCFDTKHAFQANKWYNCKVVAKVENGKITRYKYVLDGAEVSCGTGDNILMPCTNTDTSKGISRIFFDITRQTKFKNMSIYYDFSEYHDGGGSGSGSSSGT